MQTKVRKNQISDNNKFRKLGIANYIYVLKNSGILMGFILLCIFFTILSPAFLTYSNILNVLRQISINAIISFGMTFTILIGGIDLSVGSVLALTGTITAGLIVRGVTVYVSIIIGLCLGALIGLINGLLTAKLRMPPFIVTLAMMSISRGLAYVYSEGRPVRVETSQFSNIGNGYLGPIPNPIIVMVIVLILSSLLLNRTRFGRFVYAVGGNREAARFTGINTSKIELICYVICGFLAGLSGIVLAARMYSGQPIAGQGFELDAIAAVVLGGTSFLGGIGTIGGTILGALIIGILNNGLNLIHISFYWQLIIKGIVILAALYIDMLKKAKISAK